MRADVFSFLKAKDSILEKSIKLTLKVGDETYKIILTDKSLYFPMNNIEKGLRKKNNLNPRCFYIHRKTSFAHF